MKYMLLIYIDPKAGPKDGSPEQRAEHEAFGAFTGELVASGALVAGDPLHGPEAATTVRVRNGETLSSDGPFAETKERLAGFYIVDVADLDAAIGWAAKIPTVVHSSIEVRPIQDFSAM